MRNLFDIDPAPHVGIVAADTVDKVTLQLGKFYFKVSLGSLI
jgi:hypothetical protein